MHTLMDTRRFLKDSRDQLGLVFAELNKLYRQPDFSMIYPEGYAGKLIHTLHRIEALLWLAGLTDPAENDEDTGSYTRQVARKMEVFQQNIRDSFRQPDHSLHFPKGVEGDLLRAAYGAIGRVLAAS